ncbi:P-loop containing nucleoside triphosphate hydrolase protein [Peniophora sp. CONT]|nr:P-loop containing nucleoside triphosphate hydrolase protein [Peniophora sp. CONT]
MKTDEVSKDGKPEDIPEDEIESNWDQVVDRFSGYDGMGLKPQLLRGIYAYGGLEHPPPLQKHAIMPFVQGRDLIFQVQLDTSAPAAFSIGVLQKLDPNIKGTQALILAARHDTATHIQKQIVEFGDYMSVECHACVGGTNVREDVAKVKEAPHVIVGTPGRIYDMINRRALRTDNIHVFCISEADEMLLGQFKRQIFDLHRFMPQGVQTVILSAPLSADTLEDATKKLLHDPIRVLVKPNYARIYHGIKQFYIAVEKEEWKLDTLCDLYEQITITQAVIFCNRRRKVDWLEKKMLSREFTVSSLHGDMELRLREVLMKDWGTGSIRVLITTDIFTSPFGDNLSQVPLVINYDMSKNAMDYTRRLPGHRYGRFITGGAVINFVTPDDVDMIRGIEKDHNTHIPEMPLNIEELLSGKSVR